MSFQDLEAGKGRSRRINGGGRQDSTQAVASGIFQINTGVSTFQRLVNTLGTPKDTPELREKLHKTRLHIGQLVKDTSAKLKEASETDHRGGVNPSKKIADAKLAKDFQAVLKEFQKAQQTAAERETAYAPLVPPSAHPSSYTASEVDNIPEQRAQVMESKRRGRSVIAAIFIFLAMSCLNSISTTQVGTSDGDSDEMSASDTFCFSEQYIMQSYFSTHSSLNESEFRSFLRLQQCSENIPSEDVPAIAMLQHRDITGEGSHRHLLTSIKLRPFHTQSHLHELVIVERLPLGVFADPFELQSLQQRRAFRDVSVFGDTDLEQPSFRSNRSVVEIHNEINENGEISVKLPLHARYQPIGESGYSRVEFGEPDLFLCSRHVPLNQGHEQRRCLVLSIGRSKAQTRSVVWEIPAGIRSHTEYVFVITFVAAVLSALSILVASVLSPKVESCKNKKQL